MATKKYDIEEVVCFEYAGRAYSASVRYEVEISYRNDGQEDYADGWILSHDPDDIHIESIEEDVSPKRNLIMLPDYMEVCDACRRTVEDNVDTDNFNIPEPPEAPNLY